MLDSSYIIPEWNAPACINARTTTRYGGYSVSPYDSYNLGLHVNDTPANVHLNRQKLINDLHLPSEPLWLNQSHTNQCLVLKHDQRPDLPTVDAVYTQSKHIPLVILTADCVPILVCNEEGTEIAAIHAGWRGLLHGIIAQTLVHFKSKKIMAWIGPAICQNCYETSPECKHAFITSNPHTAKAFRGHSLDLAAIAQLQLQSSGVDTIFLSGLCTYEEKNTYFSYRRSPQTGRIATLIWFT